MEPGSAILTDNHATYTEGLSERRDSVSSYTHPDALGSLRTMTQGQTLVDTLVYDAFGWQSRQDVGLAGTISSERE